MLMLELLEGLRRGMIYLLYDVGGVSRDRLSPFPP